MKRAYLPSLTQNPIILKELRSRMRGNRAFMLLTVYVLFLSTLIGIIYLTFLLSDTAARTIEERQVLGKLVFSIVVITEMFMVSFVAPAISAGSIASEREHQTYDLLRTTLLPARSLVGGKFLSGLTFILLLLLAAMPLQSLTFLFGGIAIEEVLVGALLLVVMAISFCAFGIFFSSFLKRTLVSTVLTYAITIFILFGLPMLLMFVTIMISAFGTGLGSSSMNPVIEALLYTGLWLALSLNPISAAGTTEVMLIENQTLWMIDISLGSGNTIYLASPWIPYSIFYLLLSVILISLSVYIVKRAEK